jgi:ubiquinone/menaquinone biosynthesis methyltransferase
MQPTSPSLQQRLAQDFDRVADRYDTLQHFNPGYRSDLLRSARRLGAAADAQLLDLCCGTGLSTAALRQCYPKARIWALDISPGMLAIAQRKAALRDVRFVSGDAMNLEQSDATGLFDAIFMAYGIRNVPDPDLCLQRLRERLVPGGRIAFHEYSVAGSRTSRAVWNAVATALIVPLGSALTASPELFRYLRRSVNQFDSIARFEQRLRDAGFDDVRSEGMPGWRRGIVHTILATRH